MMPLYADVSVLVLSGLCLGMALAVGAAQAIASAIVALVRPAAAGGAAERGGTAEAMVEP